MEVMDKLKSSTEELRTFRDKSAIWSDILGYIIDWRIQSYDILSNVTDPAALHREQGSIKALNRLISLMDEMVDYSEATDEEERKEEGDV